MGGNADSCFFSSRSLSGPIQGSVLQGEGCKIRAQNIIGVLCYVVRVWLTSTACTPRSGQV